MTNTANLNNRTTNSIVSSNLDFSSEHKDYVTSIAANK